MKKLISVLCISVILAGVLFGCNSNDNRNENNENKQKETLASVAGNDFLITKIFLLHMRL